MSCRCPATARQPRQRHGVMGRDAVYCGACGGSIEPDAWAIKGEDLPPHVPVPTDPYLDVPPKRDTLA